MKNFEPTDHAKTVIYTITEPSTKQAPLFLQNIMYDLPFDTTNINSLTIQITVPKNTSVFIIDDLHFINIKRNKIEFTLEAASQMIYQLFVANHELCKLCERKKVYDCQKLPPIFEKKLSVKLTQPNAKAYLKCHYLGDQISEFNITTTQHHQASHTTSNVVVKGVLSDQAKLVSDNTIVVDKKIKDIIAKQKNKNLMLGRNAHVISIPKLKIESKKVACDHSVTINSLNQEELFYLQSRGIEKIDAEHLLIEAFLNI